MCPQQWCAVQEEQRELARLRHKHALNKVRMEKVHVHVHVCVWGGGGGDIVQFRCDIQCVYAHTQCTCASICTCIYMYIVYASLITRQELYSVGTHVHCVHVHVYVSESDM